MERRVSVHALWADERLYVPLELEPYTPPAHWFGLGQQDEAFALYGGHKGFRTDLAKRRGGSLSRRWGV